MKPIEGVVGTAVERLEDQRLLTGKGRFVDDIHAEGLLHAVVVRSQVPHGRIKSIDIGQAGAMPGVHAVYTANDVAALHNGNVPKVPIRVFRMPDLIRFEQEVIARDKVRYVGEPVALVVAETIAQAEDAADHIHIDVEPLAPVTNWLASKRGENLLFESVGTNSAITDIGEKGNVDAVAAPYVRREKMSVHRHSGFPMETRGLLAHWQGRHGKLTVFGGAKVPFFIRRTLAASMDLPLECIDVIEGDVGGSFGVRGEFYPEDYLVPFASRKLNRPVKWIEDRRENLLGTNHSREMEGEIEVACDRNGRVLALRGTISVDAGAYMRSTGAVPARLLALLLSGPYDIANVHVEATIYLTNKAPMGTYRGPGVYEADFFRERLFDMAARDLGIDPVEFRRINLVKPSQMPYPLPRINNPDELDELDSGDYRVTLDRCLRDFRWHEKLPLQGRMVGGRYHGIAVGCFVDGGAGGIREFARMEIESDGRIGVYVGSASVGQGLATILTQIAADALQVPPGRIVLRHGSTTYLKEGVGSGYSRSTVMGGSAIVTVANALKQRIRDAAAAAWRCAAAEVQIGPGLSVTHAGQTLTAVQLGKMKLEAEGEFSSHKHTYAYGAAAAHVAVDPRTGAVTLMDYLTVEDIGRIINPLTAHGQAVGAAVQGLGGIFLEELVYDDNGQFLSGTLADYLMPTAPDFPSVRAVVLENSPSPNNPLGAKGGGEGGIVPVAGVISNAVSAALSSLGVEVRALPLSPPTVWELIHAEEQPLNH